MKLNLMFRLKRAIARVILRTIFRRDRKVRAKKAERKHRIQGYPIFNDSSYFVGRGKDGSAMVVRQVFRNNRGNDYWLSLHLKELGNFELVNFFGTEGIGFEQGALKFVCNIPGKEWDILYSGKINQGPEEHRIELQLKFKALRPLAYFRNFTDPEDFAIAMARRRWTTKFFGRMREYRKRHYEQGGRLSGTISIDGQNKDIDWISVRNHSWGVRVWSRWERHIWLAGVLDNEEVFDISLIMFRFMGQVSAGYLSGGNQIQYIKNLPQIDEIAGMPLIPENLIIDFQTRDGNQHRLEMLISDHFDFMMDNEYYIFEGMGDFILDGIPGKGVAEFGLNPLLYDYR